jgi:putative inorganic carbon (hco3(-)) transporter
VPVPEARGAVGRSLLWFDAPLLALALAAGLGVLVAWDLRSALPAAGWLWAGIGLGLAVSHLCRGDTAWRLAGLLGIAAGAAVALYVVLQFSYLGYEAKIPALHQIGVALGGVLPRVGGWAPMPNTVATLLEGLVPLAVALAVGSMRPWSANPARAEFYEALSALSAGVMVLAIVLVASRGAWLALGAGGLAAAAAWGLGPRTGRTGKAVAIVAVALALLAAAVALRVVDAQVAGIRLSSAFDRPDRLNLFRNSLLLARDFPISGIGPGDQFAMALSRYALLIQVPFLTYAHNLYLGTWVELGVPGLIAIAALLGALLVAVAVGERAQAGAWFRGAWVGAFVVLVHGLTDARQLVDRWSWLPLFFVIGLAAARLVRRDVRPPGAAFVVPVAAIAAVVAAVWPALAPVQASWRANRAMLVEARAELGRVPDAERGRLLADARRGFEGTLALDPDHATARRRLGILATDEGQFEQARADLEASWRAAPGHPATRKALGLACAWTGRIARARELLAPVDGIFDEMNTWSSYWQQRGRLDQAIYASRVALALSPSNPEVARRLEDLERATRGQRE